MVWLTLSILGPSLWGFANVLDSGLRKKWIKDDWALTWISAFLRLPVLIVFVALAYPFEAPAKSIALMILSGFLLTFPYLFYFRALKTEDSSRIAVIIQMIPVFNLMISSIFLHERLTSTQTLAFGILFSAGILAALRLTRHKLKFSGHFLILILASFLWAVSDTLFKGAISTFPTYLDGYSLYMLGSGLVILAFLPPALKARPFRLMKRLSGIGWTLLIGTIVAGFVGTTAFTFALTLGKVSLTSVMMGVQPLAAFGINWILGRYTKVVPPEDSDRHNLWLKLMSFVLVILGLVVLELF